MQLTGQIVVDAKPEALAIDPAQSAVIVVDMQNDFGSNGGMFALAGIDISAIRNAIAPTARVLAAARRAGIGIVYLKMAFRPDLSDAGSLDGPNRIKHRRLRVGEAIVAPDGKASRILIRDTWNTEIVPELAPKRDDIVLYKHRYSGFYETDLDSVLKRRSIKSLIFTGCTTSVCVEVHPPRCDVPGLHLSPIGRLHGRARPGWYQPRRLPARRTGTNSAGFRSPHSSSLPSKSNTRRLPPDNRQPRLDQAGHVRRPPPAPTN